MVKTTSIFVCQNCGAQQPKWMGQCPECGKWDTFIEEVKSLSRAKSRDEKSKGGLRGEKAEFVPVDRVEGEVTKRISSGIDEVDQVLGGGIVPGSVVLFAGEPGIGKSTLLTQIALNLAGSEIQNSKFEILNKLKTQSSKRRKKDDREPLSNRTIEQLSVIYVCGEESPNQVKMRIGRLQGDSEVKFLDRLFLLPETDVDAIIEKVKSEKLKVKSAVKSSKVETQLLMIIDSVQTLTTEDLTGVAGSIGQVRECAHRLINFAKTTGTPVFLVGHVTKEGQLAGPKTIEHAVDTVLYFEGERSGDLRLLRSVKNRFGPTDEVGVFQMSDGGLKEVKDLSLALLGDKFSPKIGSAYTVIFEGTRPMVVEIQALATKSFVPIPKRVINGLERNRSEMLIAICQKYLKLPLWEYDVFLNVSGGFKVGEPAADLAVCAAILSSYKNKVLSAKGVFIGEVSLLGEVKEVSRMEKREKQAKALGLKKILGSATLGRIWGLGRLAN